MQKSKQSDEDDFCESYRKRNLPSEPHIPSPLPPKCSKCRGERRSQRESKQLIETLRRERFDLRLGLQITADQLDRYKHADATNEKHPLLKQLIQEETNNELLCIDLKSKEEQLQEMGRAIDYFEKREQEFVAEIEGLQRKRSNTLIAARLQVIEQELNYCEDEIIESIKTLVKLNDHIKACEKQVNDIKLKQKNIENDEDC